MPEASSEDLTPERRDRRPLRPGEISHQDTALGGVRTDVSYPDPDFDECDPPLDPEQYEPLSPGESEDVLKTRLAGLTKLIRQKIVLPLLKKLGIENELSCIERGTYKESQRAADAIIEATGRGKDKSVKFSKELGKGQVELDGESTEMAAKDSLAYEALHADQLRGELEASEIADENGAFMTSTGIVAALYDPNWARLRNITQSPRFLQMVNILARRTTKGISGVFKKAVGKFLKVEIFDDEENGRQIKFKTEEDELHLKRVTLAAERFNTSYQGHSDPREKAVIYPHGEKKTIELDAERAVVVEHRMQEIAGLFEAAVSVNSPILHGVKTGAKGTRHFLFGGSVSLSVFGPMLDKWLDDPLEQIRHALLKTLIAKSNKDACGFEDAMREAVLTVKQTWPNVRICFRNLKDGKICIWIETREICNQPTTTDRISSKMFRDGMSLALREYFTEKGIDYMGDSEEFEKSFPYEKFKHALHQMFADGIDSEIEWLGKKIKVKDFINEELMPRAERLLPKNGVHKRSVKRYLGNIKQRLNFEFNGKKGWDPADVLGFIYDHRLDKICRESGLSKAEVLSSEEHRDKLLHYMTEVERSMYETDLKISAKDRVEHEGYLLPTKGCTCIEWFQGWLKKEGLSQ